MNSYSYWSPVIILNAFNSGFHTIVLTDFKLLHEKEIVIGYDHLLVNDELDKEIFDSDYQDCDQTIPRVLEEGQLFRVVYKSEGIRKLIKEVFHDRGIERDIVKLTACFTTGQDKEICSKSIEFRLDKKYKDMSEY